jgi:hypothetical protein
MVLNANFLAFYNGCIMQNIRDCVEIASEHAHT